MQDFVSVLRYMKGVTHTDPEGTPFALESHAVI